MKDDTCLTRLTEVQVVPHDNVEKVVRGQCAVRWRLDVVAGDKELLPPIWGREDRSFRVVLSVGKKLQGQKRMSGPAFSQVNLDGIRFPFSISARTTTKSKAKRPITPSFARRLPTLAASRVMSGA